MADHIDHHRYRNRGFCYFCRSVPKSLPAHDPKPSIVIALKTRQFRDALRQSQIISKRHATLTLTTGNSDYPDSRSAASQKGKTDIHCLTAADYASVERSGCFVQPRILPMFPDHSTMIHSLEYPNKTPNKTPETTFKRRMITTTIFAFGAVALAACGNDTPPVTAYGLDSCVTDPAVCNTDDLCRLAVFEEDNIKRWNDDNLRWQPYVREAQSRGLSCGL